MYAVLAPVLVAAAPVRVGAAKTVVTPDLKVHGPVYIAGYDNNRVATGVHDDLYARCMAVDAGTRPVVMCGVDIIGIYWDDVRIIRAQVGGADVMVAATHVHEGPDTMGLWGHGQDRTGINDEYMRFLAERTAAAARGAIANLRPARVRLATVHQPELDAFIADNRPPAIHDSDVIALQAVGLKGVLSAPYRMLFGLASDENGYIIPNAEWDENAPWLQNSRERWYGEVNSIGPDAAPIIAEIFRQFLGNDKTRN